MSLENPVFVSAYKDLPCVSPDQLFQSYLVCNEEEKINLLWSFITTKEYQKKKSLVFVTCCKQARYIAMAFCHLRPGISVMALWGDMKQEKRIRCYDRFKRKSDGALLIATDLASRGLDFQNLNYVIQMDCPATVEDYIHRVGRTARMDNYGEAIIFLTPNQESPFLKILKNRSIPISKVLAPTEKVKNISQRLSNLMVPFPELRQFAQRSINAYARALYFMAQKDVFDVSTINFCALARSHGLPNAPRIRFLRKRGIRLGRDISESHATKRNDTELVNLHDPDGEFSADNLEEEQVNAEEVLSIKRRDVFNSLDYVDKNEDILSRISTKKPITKADVAKRMIRRLGIVAKRKRFTNDDDSS